MQLGSEVVVTVADDGRGIDLERVREEDWVEGQVVIRVRDQILPVSDLAVTLDTVPAEAPGGVRPAVVVASMTRRHAFEVDALLGQRNVVVKDLGRLLPRLSLLAGAALEPDGSILLVLDVSGLVDRARWIRSSGGAAGALRAAAPSTPAGPPEPAGPPSVLVCPRSPSSSAPPPRSSASDRSTVASATR
jgi:chemotaxis protein histidine kinase CheA